MPEITDDDIKTSDTGTPQPGFDDPPGDGTGWPRRHGEQPMIDIASFPPAYLTFIANKWSRSASKLYLHRFGIGVEAWRILGILAIDGRQTAHRIVEVICMDKASVSRNLKSLHEAGLITLTIDPGDARQKLAELTQAGFAVHDRIFAVAVARAEKLTACLSAEEKASFLQLLARVHANLAVLDEDGEYDDEDADSLDEEAGSA